MNEITQLIVAAVAVAVACGYYWGKDQYPLSYVKTPLVNWLYDRGRTIDGYPMEGEESFLQVAGFGFNCGVCVGQWVSFALAWAWLGYSPVENPIGFLVVAVAINSLNLAYSEWSERVADRYAMLDESGTTIDPSLE